MIFPNFKHSVVALCRSQECYQDTWKRYAIRYQVSMKDHDFPICDLATLNFLGRVLVKQVAGYSRTTARNKLSC